MNIIEEMIRTVYGNRISVSSLTREQMDDLVSSSMGYVLRVVSAGKMTSIHRIATGDRSIPAIDFRSSLNTSYIMKNLKLFIWWVVSKRLTKEEARKCRRHFDVRKRDFSILGIVLRNKELKSDLVNLSKRYSCHSLKRFDHFLIKFIKDIESSNYIEKFVYRKLRFLTLNGVLTSEDIASELLYYGFLGIQKKYPVVDSYLHMLNIGKTCIHNRGINLIHQSSRVKNKFLKKAEDGTFDQQIISLSTRDGFDSGINESLLGNTPSPEDSYDTELEMLNKVVDSFSGKKRKFLEIMLGRQDEGFNNWMVDRYGESFDIPDSDLSIYLGTYMGVSSEDVRCLFEEMRDRWEAISGEAIYEQ